MLAEIHGKISKSCSNLSETLEDKLTGDFFGVSRYLPAELLLMPFLRRAYWINPLNNQQTTLNLNFSSEPEIEFWPKCYSGIEPDIEVVVNSGNTKVKILIEVKFKSGLSGDDTNEELPTPDNSENQLVKQFLALISESDANRKILIFLTEDGAYPKETMNKVAKILQTYLRHEVSEIFWLSWHEIHEILSSLRDTPLDLYQSRIIEDLFQYCNKKGFRRFRLHQPINGLDWHFSLARNYFKEICSFKFNHLSSGHDYKISEWRFEK